MTSATSPTVTTPASGFGTLGTSGSDSKSSIVSTAEPTCTAIDPLVSVIEPTGSTRPLAVIAVTMSRCVRPLAASAAWSRVRFTLFSLAPETAMSRMPSTCSKRVGATSSSFLPIRSLFPLLSETAKTMIGTESKLPEITLGDASDGNRSDASFRAVLSLSETASVVVPYSKETLRTERPVVEVTVVDSMPSRPRTICSSGVETWLSTTSGDAPG